MILASILAEIDANHDSVRLTQAAALGIGLVASLIYNIYLKRKTRAELESLATQLRATRASQQSEFDAAERRKAEESKLLQQQREARSFQQHELINEIGVEKLRAEAHLLELNAKIAQTELTRRDREEVHHKLAVEKFNLEIEQLRLRNRQLRRELGDEREYE